MHNQMQWGIKLHNNPLAHQNTPADYIMTHKERAQDYFRVILVECKQVTCENGQGRLAFKRLKQLHDMLAFIKATPIFHEAYFCIAFYNDRWDKSDVYLVRAEKMFELITHRNKQSLNRTEAALIFKDDKIGFVGGELQLLNRLSLSM